MSYYTFIREKLENLINEFINLKTTENYLEILKKQGNIPQELIVKYTKNFIEKLKKEIPEDEYNAICGGIKDNRKFIYNPIVLISRLERKIIKIDKRPNFSNFIDSLDNLIKRLNETGTYVRYPYSIVMIFEGNGIKEAYEIPLVKIPEAYFLLIYNKDNPLKKYPPMKEGKFINEFEIEINSNPKKDFTKVYVEGYQNQGIFRIYSDSIGDRMQRMRKIKYEEEIYYTNVFGRAPLQTLYILNLLENEINNSGFKVVVPAPSLLKIISSIYKSLLISNKRIELPIIFTYLLLHAEISKRKEEGIDSFYITHHITREKLDNLYNILYPSIKDIEKILRVRYSMKMSAVF